MNSHFFSTVLLVFFLFSCKTDINEVRKISDKRDYNKEIGKEVEILYSDSAQVRVKLLAQKIVRHLGEEPQTEMPEGVKVFFYNDEMEIDSRLSANYAISYDSKDEILMQNNVVVINTKGEKLATEELIWNQKSEKVYSNKFVKITTKDEIIFGDELESDQTFSEYKIKKIKGTINVKQDNSAEDS